MMHEEQNESRTTPQPAAPSARRKPYAAPQVTEWGSVHVLTQGDSGGVADAPVSATRRTA